jgi:hypothetical protein
MKIPSIFLMLVGCIWALFVLWMFLTLAGIAEFAWSLFGVLYWVAMLIGPIVLIVGSWLTLRGRFGRGGAILIAIGCLILTGLVLYNSTAGMHREPLEAPPSYPFYAVLVLTMLLADIAGFKVVRRLLIAHTAAH